MPDSITAAEVTIVAPGNLKHGLNAESIVIPSEAENDWVAHRNETIDAYDPKTCVEHALAYRVAECLWRLRRASRAETNAINAHEADLDRMQKLERDRNLPRAIRYSILAIPPERTLDPVIRYEAHLNRMLYQAMHELEALQASRSGKTSPLARVQVHGLPAS